ncbi:MAG: recombinase family protein [Bacteroidetes bacterium]|nr:recombinase family protein [Bacteroidota bacterium]
MDKTNDIMVLGYCRVSTIEQKQNTSLRLQLKSIQQFCDSQNWKLVTHFEDAESGSSLNRPGFNQLLDTIKHFEIDGIVIWKLDRLSRSLVDGKQFLNDLEDSGLFIKSVTEAFIDTSTPIGKMVINMILSFAEFERDLISERMMNGKRMAFDEGRRVEGRIPFGYNKNGSNELSVCYDEADIVRFIFKTYSKVRSVRKTKALLDYEDIRNREDKWFSSMNIYKILRNRIYVGYVKYDGEWKDGLHEPIVSKHMYSRVNNILNR